jgi:nicotinamidase-related amidase
MSDCRYTDPDFAAVALITIDMQQDVLDGGPLEIPGTSEAGQRIARLARAFRDADRPIVHMVRLYEPNGSNVDLCRREAVQRGARILTPGTPGSQLALELPSTSNQELDDAKLLAAGIQRLGPSEVVIYKPRWGAFYRTPLERYLRARNISTLVFCGCNFPNCPRTSIYEASERDFRIVLVRDAVSGLYQRGEEELGNIGGHVLDTDDVLDALHSRHGYAPSSR